MSNTSRARHLDNLGDFARGARRFDDVIDDFVRIYSDNVNSNQRWKWRDIPGSEHLSEAQLNQIRELARSNGYIPTIPTKPSGHPDFSEVVQRVDNLPEDMWRLSDRAQFDWLDSRLPDGVRPEGLTWHHSEIPGRMELVPFGIHNATGHTGGRAPGNWANAPR